MKIQDNYTMLCDFYELTMANAYFENGYGNKIVTFDLFFRRIPDDGGYVIASGLESIVKYINDLKFNEEDIEYLRSRNMFSEQFLQFLKTFKFTGSIYAVKEGTVVFPKEPLIIVKAPLIEAQFIETYLLLAFNHQSLIATKGSRLKYAAGNDLVMEFGSRRAHGATAAIYGARASYIGGVDKTACTQAGAEFNIPVTGTMAHSFVQLFDDEYTAFRTYVETYKDNPVFLVDTYDTIKSGLPAVIKLYNDYLLPNGIEKFGIRIDSGDLAYLTKKARKILDEAGCTKAFISVSNALDERLISVLKSQNAKIDAYGVGENLITSKSQPVFGGVYKLSSVYNNDIETPKIKLSNDSVKVTIPGFKKVLRIFDKDTNMAIADLICKFEEELDDTKELVIFDENDIWKEKVINNYYFEELLEPIFIDGKQVYTLPTIEEIRQHKNKSFNSMWEELKRFDYPHKYYVDLSKKLWDLKQQLIKKNKR